MDSPSITITIASTVDNECEVSYCRCCFKTSTEVENLFDMKIVAFDFLESQTTTYFKAYQETSGCCVKRLTEISSESYMICSKCAIQLESAYTFRTKCISVMDELERRFNLKQTHVEQPKTEAMSDDDSGSEIELEVHIKDELPDTDNENETLPDNNGGDDDQLLVRIKETPNKPEPALVIDYRCKFCPKKFRHEYNFRQHCREAHKAKTFKCVPCNMIYSHKSSYLRHKEFKHFQSGFPCQHCEATFMSIATLEYHQKFHHKYKLRYQCPQCDRSFTYGPNVWAHSFAHAIPKELPFKCPDCKYNTAHLGQFKMHLKNQHRIEYDEERFGYQAFSSKSMASLLKSSKVYLPDDSK